MVKFKNEIKNGFTIIEVVLVLAVAGLIFLTVFLAVPALQRTQRDTARKKNVAELMAAVVAYRSNNKGRLPPTDNGRWPDLAKYWEKSHLLGEYKYAGKSNHIDTWSKNGELEVVEFSRKPRTSAEPGEWILGKGVGCNQNEDGGWNFVAGTETKEKFAVLVLLETNKPKAGWSYCVDLTE